MSEPARDPVDTRYRVVLNDEDQYSVWADGMPIPVGWRAEGFQGSKQDCLAHVERVWTDMRPRSLRPAAETRE